jgi:enoyl-CoA hydratase
MTERVHFEQLGHIALVRLDDGKANAMQKEWFAALGSVLERIEHAAARSEPGDVRCLILLGRPGFFSGGLDLKVLPRLAPRELRDTTAVFMETMRRVFLLPVPVVAASEGHAIAGGMMLYLAADWRIAVDDERSRYGLNEARTGIPLLGGTLGICEHEIPPAHHTEMILHGAMLSARETFERCVTHRLVASSEALLPAALAVAENLAELEPHAYRLNKQLMRGPAYASAVARANALADEAPKQNVFAHLAR